MHLECTWTVHRGFLMGRLCPGRPLRRPSAMSFMISQMDGRRPSSCDRLSLSANCVLGASGQQYVAELGTLSTQWNPEGHPNLTPTWQETGSSVAALDKCGPKAHGGTKMLRHFGTLVQSVPWQVELAIMTHSWSCGQSSCSHGLSHSHEMQPFTSVRNP